MVKKYPQNPILGTISNHYFFDSVMLEASERDASLSQIHRWGLRKIRSIRDAFQTDDRWWQQRFCHAIQRVMNNRYVLLCKTTLLSRNGWREAVWNSPPKRKITMPKRRTTPVVCLRCRPWRTAETVIFYKLFFKVLTILYLTFFHE